ncbi:MAG: YfgM family protein [Candidatus Oxydemutatoraceae bacterium WSBS_2016_MAG_OTU14]
MTRKKSALRKSASLTQEEAVESFRGWWENNWGWLFGGMMVLILFLGAWYAWNVNRDNRGDEAAQIYFDLLEKGEGYKLFKEQLEQSDLAQKTTAINTVEPITSEEYLQLINESVIALDEFSEAPYISAVRLLRAKHLTELNNYQSATEDLHWVLEDGQQDSFKVLALHRLLRIYIQGKHYKNVINSVLDYDLPEGTSTYFNEILGDAYLGLGQRNDAQKAYSKAIKNFYGDVPLVLQLKLQNAGGVGFKEPWKAVQGAP